VIISTGACALLLALARYCWRWRAIAGARRAMRNLGTVLCAGTILHPFSLRLSRAWPHEMKMVVSQTAINIRGVEIAGTPHSPRLNSHHTYRSSTE
jgi:hypothetical protein